MTRISRSAAYALQVRADRRQAALDRAAERAATGTNDLIESKALHANADRPMTAREKAQAEAEQRQYVLYTREERMLIARLYNNGGTREGIVAAFRQVFGNRHSSASIGQKVEMCRVADRRQTEHTAFVFRDEQLLDILTDLDAERYVVG